MSTPSSLSRPINRGRSSRKPFPVRFVLTFRILPEVKNIYQQHAGHGMCGKKRVLRDPGGVPRYFRPNTPINMRICRGKFGREFAKRVYSYVSGPFDSIMVFSLSRAKIKETNGRRGKIAPFSYRVCLSGDWACQWCAGVFVFVFREWLILSGSKYFIFVIANLSSSCVSFISVSEQSFFGTEMTVQVFKHLSFTEWFIYWSR